jgi:hypothetical protein
MNAFELYETVDQRFKALVQSNLSLQKNLDWASLD